MNDLVTTYLSTYLRIYAQGLTKVATNDTPFRKNAAFSTPIEESLDN